MQKISLFLGSSDLGGPRKEFFQIILAEIKEKLTHNNKLYTKESFLDNRFYYAIGILLGKLTFFRAIAVSDIKNNIV